MEIRRLGRSELPISSLGLGCWAFGGGRYWGGQSQKDTDEVVHAALDHGITYFDTAEVYNDGESERSLGLALKGRRSGAVIGTKDSTSNTKETVLREHCEASLKRLGTDCIDIYMLHWPINAKAIEHFSADPMLVLSPPAMEEAFGMLMQFRKEGKIREIGISNHCVVQMEEIRKTGADVVANELPYNLVSRAIEESILPYCLRNRIGVIGYMAMQQGVLAGIYPTFDAIPPAQAHSRHFRQSRGGVESRHHEDGAEGEMLVLLQEMKMIAKSLGMAVPMLSLAWAMANRGIDCTLVGSRSLTKLEMNIEAASCRLSADVLEQLNRLSQPVLEKLGDNPDYYENRLQSRVH
jgi:aryl-alcohol dehydrogenase-like predicted oxidoreductase